LAPLHFFFFVIYFLQAMHWKSGHKSECPKLIYTDSSIANNGNGTEDLNVSKFGNGYVFMLEL
jgi:hypothetical protein